MSVMRTICLVGLCAAAGGCDIERRPSVRQLECTLQAMPGAPRPLILLVDTGRRDVTFATLPDHPVRAIAVNRYAYRFDYPLAGGTGHAVIGRLDGAIQVMLGAAKGSPAAKYSGLCKSVAKGPRL